MKERHRALIVEDDKEAAEDLLEILHSIDCDGVVVDNREAAVAALNASGYCLVLLDLQIKSASDSIKGHVEHGKALLRGIRQTHREYNGTAFWLPIVIVSGFARERDEAVDIMKDGASDIIQKPFDSQQVSETIRRALQASGRDNHTLCDGPPPTERADTQQAVVVAIPGDRVRRRTRVTLASKSVDLTDGSLKLLLRLLLARRNGELVNKVDMGATADQGFKGISILRNELKPALGGVDIIKSHYHGDYGLTDQVTIGECAVDKLRALGDATISDLAAQLQRTPSIPTESDGNSREFPTQRRRRRN